MIDFHETWCGAVRWTAMPDSIKQQPSDSRWERVQWAGPWGGEDEVMVQGDPIMYEIVHDGYNQDFDLTGAAWCFV